MFKPLTPFSTPTRSHQRLLWALGISVLLHGVFLTVKWISPSSIDRIFQSQSLEVVLVNSRSTHSPDKPMALAQSNLAGGGQVDGLQLQTSMQSVSTQDQTGEDLQQVEKKIERLQSEQLRLIQQLKREMFELNSQAASAPQGTTDADTLNERKKQLSNQLAHIEKQSQALQGGRKKRYIGPATQESNFARYYDKMRRTIETTGTENFPQASGEKLYGSLTMVITLNANGKVIQTEIAKSSGRTVLDQRAVAIVQGASPFDNFSAEMKKEADQLVVVTRFNFARDETLETRMLSPQSQTP
jgi:periplasmic protein TonB